MLLICALTNAFDILSIRYSIAVFADGNYKLVIKRFEENNSPLVLQKNIGLFVY